jgi:hypothetical protein
MLKAGDAEDWGNGSGNSLQVKEKANIHFCLFNGRVYFLLKLLERRVD